MREVARVAQSLGQGARNSHRQVCPTRPRKRLLGTAARAGLWLGRLKHGQGERTGRSRRARRLPIRPQQRAARPRKPKDAGMAYVWFGLREGNVFKSEGETKSNGLLRRARAREAQQAGRYLQPPQPATRTPVRSKLTVNVTIFPRNRPSAPASPA